MNGSPERPRTWHAVAGAWLGIGTSPGALLLGATIAARHRAPIPLLALFGGILLIAAILWFQGKLGLAPPHGDGGTLAEIAPRYFDAPLQRGFGALLALGMIGWFAFNVGFGGAAFGALIGQPQWLGTLALAVPITFFSIRGITSWNGLAILTTLSVIALVAFAVIRFAARVQPVTPNVDDPLQILSDVAALVGYVSLFSVRAPDFSARLGSRRDLLIAMILLCVPLVGVILAGAILQQGTGSADLVSVLAEPANLGLGNLLIALAVIAPAFTTFYSGVPALRAAIHVPEKTAMLIIAGIGLALAVARFDLWLLSWLSILAAVLPPLVVPLAWESTARRRGHAPHFIPIWVWLASASIALGLTLAQNAFALFAGLFVAALATGAWRFKIRNWRRDK